MSSLRQMGLVLAIAVLVVLAALPAAAAPAAGFGHLFYEGEVVRTVVPPAAMKKEGVDNLYVVMGGTADQIPVAAVAPGDPDYHGGKWAFHAVTWNVDPYTLTSEAAVLKAAEDGDVTVSRVVENDFTCPIQP